MNLRSTTWLTVVGGTALLALGTVGCGAYEPEPEYPQYEYAPPPPPRAVSDDVLAQQQMGPNVPNEQEMGTGQEVAIGEGKGDEYSDTDPSALNEFKPALEGHGQWVDDATYGTVWVPNSAEVGTDFQPYATAGHWTYDDTSDYVWVSDYSWGWAPFHYGRWAYVGPYGWSWIPGRVYSGAWVSWRVGPAGYGYIGWGPMAPDWYWYHGTAVGWSFGYYHPYDHYCYAPRGNFYAHDVGRYAVGGPAGRPYYEHTVAYAPPARVGANPTVNGRVAASPTVNRGPTPNEMGIGRDAVVAPPAQNQGLNQARAMATPSTATARGAAAPFRTATNTQSTGGFAAGSRGPASTAMTNGQGAPAFRQNGSAQAGSAFASRSTPVTRNPTAPSNSTPAFHPSSTASHSVGTSTAPSSRGFTGQAAAPRASAPAFRSSGSSIQSYSHSTPSYTQHASAPSMHQSYSGSSGSSSHSSSSGRSGGGGGGGHSSGGHRR